jgi:hypothetical protein
MSIMTLIIHPQMTGSLREYSVSLYLVIVVLFLFPCVVSAAEPILSGITPADGINTNQVFVNISGTDFATGANVMLTPVNPRMVHKSSIIDGKGGTLLKRPTSVFVFGNYAYVTSEDSNALEIIDISDPAHPAHKGSIVNGDGGALISKPYSVSVSGKYAYITSCGTGSLEIVDISDPALPVHMGSYAISGHGILKDVWMTVTISGNYAYFANSGGSTVEIIDISDPAHPVHKGSISDGDGGALLVSPSAIVIAGNYAYITSYSRDALEIVDISDPVHPVHKGSIVNGDGGALLGSPNDVFVSGNYAYIASAGNDALEVVDVTDPAHPVHKGSIVDNSIKDGDTALNGPKSVWVSGNYAYIASQSSFALEVVDVSDPANPVHKDSIVHKYVKKGQGSGALLDNPYSVVVSGTNAYIATYGSDAVEIVDTGAIPGTGVTVISPTQITCTFNLTNKNDGPYNVVITNPDGSFGVLANGFAVIPSTVPTAKQSPLSSILPVGAVLCAGVMAVVAIRRNRK